MPTMLERLKDAVVYKRIKYPLSLAEALAYLTVNNFLTPSGRPYSATELKHQLQTAKSNQQIINVHDLWWFPDINVSDRDYLRGLLSVLRHKNLKNNIAF